MPSGREGQRRNLRGEQFDELSQLDQARRRIVEKLTIGGELTHSGFRTEDLNLIQMYEQYTAIGQPDWSVVAVMGPRTSH